MSVLGFEGFRGFRVLGLGFWGLGFGVLGLWPSAWGFGGV